MRRWLPFQMMLAVVVALTLLSLQLVFAQTDPNAPPAGQTLQLQKNDTLVALAARLNKPVACLQKANKFASTNFSLTGSTGNISTSGDIAVNGNDITTTATNLE